MYLVVNSIQQNEILANILWTWVCDINVSTCCTANTNRLWLCEQCEFNLFKFLPEIEYVFPAASPPALPPPAPLLSAQSNCDGVMYSCWPRRMVIRASCLGLASVSGGHWAVGFVNASWLMTYYDVRLIRSFSKWLPRSRSLSLALATALCKRSHKRNVLFAWIRQESTFNLRLTLTSLCTKFSSFGRDSFVIINLKNTFKLTKLCLF